MVQMPGHQYFLLKGAPPLTRSTDDTKQTENVIWRHACHVSFCRSERIALYLALLRWSLLSQTPVASYKPCAIGMMPIMRLLTGLLQLSAGRHRLQEDQVLQYHKSLLCQR